MNKTNQRRWFAVLAAGAIFSVFLFNKANFDVSEIAPEGEEPIHFYVV